MKLQYKKVKLLMPHCPTCGEMLSGNNSMISPYRCSCGVWKNSWSNPHEYIIEPPKPSEE